MLFGTEKYPKPPSFKRAKCHTTSLSGNRLSFKVPPSFGFDSHYQESVEPEIDIFQSEIYQPFIKSGETESRFDAELLSLFVGSWQFKGIPFLQDYYGEVILNIKIFDLSVLPEGESLFDSGIFSREVDRWIDEGILSKTHQGIGETSYDFGIGQWPNFLSPVNGQWLERNGLDWYYFESCPLWGKSTRCTWQTPIGHRNYLQINFSINKSTYNAGNPYRVDQRIPSTAYLDYIHKVMDGLELTLSAEALKQQSEIPLERRQLRPNLACTAEQIEQAKYVTYMWSGMEYTEKNCQDHMGRASKEEISKYIDEKIKFRPLPGSYSVKALASD